MTEECKYWDSEIKTCRRSEVPKIENRWIPVTERLPDKDGRYLCSYETEFGTCIDFGWFEEDDWWIGRVTAWMPLPEPWKGDEE